MTQGDAERDRQPARCGHQGAGFFQVQRPDGTIAYTRAGQFHLNNQGTMVTTDGDPLIPTITIPPNATSVTITQYGVVNATLPGQQNPSQLGQIQLATFPNPGGLESMGSESAAGHAQLRRPGARQSRRDRRTGNTAAGISGELECGRGDRVRADGAGAARLRIELQGDQGGGRHVFAGQQYDAISPGRRQARRESRMQRDDRTRRHIGSSRGLRALALLMLATGLPVMAQKAVSLAVQRRDGRSQAGQSRN